MAPDAQKLLDLYIHEYLVKKKMHTTANIFAQEARIQPMPSSVFIKDARSLNDIRTLWNIFQANSSPKGFLPDWWSLFWDVYSSRPRNNLRAEISLDKASSTSQNYVPNVNSRVRNISPPMRSPGIPTLLRAVDPAPMPNPEMGSSVQNDDLAMMETMDFNANWLGQTSTDGSMMQDKGSSASQNYLPVVNSMVRNISPPMRSPGIPNLLRVVNPAPMPSPEMGSSVRNDESAMMETMDFNANQFGQTFIDGRMMQDKGSSASQNYVPDVNPMVRNISPATRSPGIPNLLRVVNPAPMPSPEMGSSVQNDDLEMMETIDFDWLWQTFTDDSTTQEQMITDGGTSQEEIARGKQQLLVTNYVNYGTSLRRSVTSELPPHAPNRLQDDIGNANDAGRKLLEKFPSEESFLAVSDQQIKYSALSDGCRAHNSDLAAHASKNLTICASENTTEKISPTLIDDGSKGNNVQIERNAEIEKPLDEDIACFFTKDEASNIINESSTYTLAQYRSMQRDFPFGPVKTIQPSDDILSCCDFSAQGKFLVAAGHEKKVFIWNLRKAAPFSIEAHTQLITDIRFKPNSTIFATSSFDKIVKIWDAVNRKRRPIANLPGHPDLVNSVDFHPRKADLLCSCDCNDEIRLWNTKDSTCSRAFKGANRQVRFQPRQGNLLAAATGTAINLIDVETSTIQCHFEGHEKDVLTLCWDACGKHLVSTSSDCTCIWSVLAGGKCLHKLVSSDGDFASSTFHPSQSQVVAVGSKRLVYLWNPTMGNRLWKFPGHQGVISSMANSPEKSMIATVSHDQFVKIWR